MKKYIIIFFSLFATSSLFAQKEDSNHEWLSYSKELPVPNVCADSLYNICHHLNLYYLDPEHFTYPLPDNESKILKYNHYGHVFEFEGNKYILSYKLFVSCFNEKILVELGFIEAELHYDWGNRNIRIHKSDYMTVGSSGVRPNYRKHDKILREQILPEFFNEICNKIKVDLVILRQ